MKIRTVPTPFKFLIILSFGQSMAADLTWDNGSTNGLWDTTSANWGGPLWNNATPDNAIFGATGAGAITLGENITVGNITFSANGYSIAAGGNNITLSSPSTITANNDAAINAALTGSVGLTKEGAGTLSLGSTNSYTGATIINTGMVDITSGAGHSNAISVGSAITVNSGATLKYSGAVNTLRRGSGDAMITLNGGTLDYAAASHGHMGNITLQNGALWTATAGGGYNSENMQLNGTVTVSGTSASTIGSFSQGLALNGIREFNVANVDGGAGVDLNVQGELENNDSGAGDGINKTGLGTMRLSNTGKTYSGATNVNGGTLLVNTTLRNTSGITVGNGATAELGATNIFVGGHGTALADSRAITVNGGTLLMNGSFDARFGNVNLNDGATWTSNRALTQWDALLADTSAGAATVTVGGTGASTMNGSGGIHLKGVQNFNVSDASGDAGGDLFVNMTLDNAGNAGGTGGVNKLGDGRMVIQKRMTYTGGTTVSAGVLEISGGGGAAGAIRGTLTINDGGRVELNAGDALGYGSGSDSISAININDTGVLHRIGGANETLGSVAITMDGGTISSSAAGQKYDLFGGGTSITVNNASATPGKESVITAALDLRQDNVDFTVNNDAVLRVNVINRDSGNSLTKKGNGTMIIDGVSTYSSNTLIDEGKFVLGAGGSIDNSATISVQSGAEFDVSAVTGGFELQNGQTLTGNGAVVGGMELLAGSILAPGNSPGTMTFDSALVMFDGSTLDIELNGGDQTVGGGVNDLLASITDLTIDGTINITEDTTTFAGNAADGDRWVFAQYSGTLTDNGLDIGALPTLDSGLQAEIDTSVSGEVALLITAIPEPSSALLCVVGGMFLALRRKK